MKPGIYATGRGTNIIMTRRKDDSGWTIDRTLKEGDIVFVTGVVRVRHIPSERENRKGHTLIYAEIVVPDIGFRWILSDNLRPIQT
jgi:hypothetical protein